MAYASVASLIQTIDLVNYHGDSSISSRFKDQITSLHKHTSFLQSFLEDGDQNRAKNWEETIRDVADRAEEIIDLLVSDSLLKTSSGSKSELDSSFDELESVTEEMKSVADRVKGRRSNKAKAEPDKELMEIVTLLRQGSDRLETIAILGSAGIGKSALAGNACNHPLTVEHFDVRASATVSRERSRQGIVLDLLRTVKIEVESDDSDYDFIKLLYRNLEGKRYLIVMYDVWSIDALDMLIEAFPVKENGSRIIVTTRDLRLAETVSDHIHTMSYLDDDETWDLLRDKIFKGDPCPSELETTGKTIARSCGGIPRSVELVSVILGDDQTEAAWEDVAQSIEDILIHDRGLEQMLCVSHTHLPHHLRPCFLYLAIFPEGRQIHLSRLIKLWVAEGFLHEGGSKSVQETEEEHVEYLVRRSLVSVSNKKYNGKIKSITIHESTRDWCKMQARKEHFLSRDNAFELEFGSCRRVSSSNHTHDLLRGAYRSTLRTIVLCLNFGEEGVRWSIGNVRLLRILDLSNAHHYDLPEDVFQLFHLRYLSFHYDFTVSEAISNLQNLQTLIIVPRYGWDIFKDLPMGIWRMPQLRHLFNFTFTFTLPIPPLKQGDGDGEGDGEGEGETSALENLETLCTVVDFVCSKRNIEMIPNVKKLGLYYSLRSGDAAKDYELHNLIYFQKLETLKIDRVFLPLDGYRRRKMSCVFPPSLKKLNLHGVQLLREDMKIVASLPNLKVLKLREVAFESDIWRTDKGGFSRLEYLLFEESDLEIWRSGVDHFPKLRTLVLRRCLNLSKVPDEIWSIPTLELIELDGMGESILHSAEKIQEKRRSSEDDRLQIRVV